MNLPLTLASSSPARNSLLKRLQQEFTVCAPDIDETPLVNEEPDELVRRLTEAKAQAVAEKFPCHLIISSDQVIILNGKICGKPSDHQAAVAQLRESSGQWVKSLTGLGLLNTLTGSFQFACITTDVLFRELSEQEIAAYLLKDQPYHCAGSLRVEALGISLLEKISSDDPTALIGLPLIELVSFLRNENFVILK